MMAALLAQDQSALQPEILAEKQLERIKRSVDAVTELLRFTDLDEHIGDRSDFRSMEELVADFDEKLKACFGNFDANAELIDGVNPLTEDTVLKNDEIWNVLTSNYGNVMPVDWNRSRTRSLQLPVLHIEDRPLPQLSYSSTQQFYSSYSSPQLSYSFFSSLSSPTASLAALSSPSALLQPLQLPQLSYSFFSSLSSPTAPIAPSALLQLLQLPQLSYSPYSSLSSPTASLAPLSSPLALLQPLQLPQLSYSFFSSLSSPTAPTAPSALLQLLYLPSAQPQLSYSPYSSLSSPTASLSLLSSPSAFLQPLQLPQLSYSFFSSPQLSYSFFNSLSSPTASSAPSALLQPLQLPQLSYSSYRSYSSPAALLVDNVNLDVSDDEELREQMDMHSIIVSCINDEPFLTAEQVIEELEEMMQESPDMQAEQNPFKSNLIRRSNGHGFEERVRNLSVAELNELLEEVETAIRHYSEELVRQLALRDELEFEKEVMNSFISVLIDVQNLQKEHKELLKKKRKGKSGKKEQNGRLHRLSASHFSMESISSAIQNGFRQTFGNMGGDKQYLTTVIPYEKKDVPPSVEDLQVLTKILQAMKDDSDKVPSLLTDYILKARSGVSLLALV
ncbi:hypothetical protein QTP70_025131 [Hemibagrus guttatus]|uniref:Fasciculation and elongation protein zeta 2 n=1 Tax=Hemibagrus guttatus TaxID=175788 RepID=A0AAE0VA49_9TELE|nr:hypothetical protein QTP70_025131 [Hemibagrus guttatus]